MLLKDIMTRKVITIFPNLPVSEAARRMEEHNVGCLLVTTDGYAKGILTDRDIVLKVIAKGSDPILIKVADIMQPHVIAAGPEMDVLEASRLMSFNHVRRLPVQENGQIVGIVSAMDLARVIQEEMDNLFSLRSAVAYH